MWADRAWDIPSSHEQQLHAHDPQPGGQCSDCDQHQTPSPHVPLAPVDDFASMLNSFLGLMATVRSETVANVDANGADDEDNAADGTVATSCVFSDLAGRLFPHIVPPSCDDNSPLDSPRSADAPQVVPWSTSSAISLGDSCEHACAQVGLERSDEGACVSASDSAEYHSGVFQLSSFGDAKLLGLEFDPAVIISRLDSGKSDGDENRGHQEETVNLHILPTVKETEHLE